MNSDLPCALVGSSRLVGADRSDAALQHPFIRRAGSPRDKITPLCAQGALTRSPPQLDVARAAARIPASPHLPSQIKVEDRRDSPNR